MCCLIIKTRKLSKVSVNMKKEDIRFDDPELERIYQECMRRDIFRKLKEAHRKHKLR